MGYLPDFLLQMQSKPLRTQPAMGNKTKEISMPGSRGIS